MVDLVRQSRAFFELNRRENAGQKGIFDGYIRSWDAGGIVGVQSRSFFEINRRENAGQKGIFDGYIGRWDSGGTVGVGLRTQYGSPWRSQQYRFVVCSTRVRAKPYRYLLLRSTYVLLVLVLVQSKTISCYSTRRPRYTVCHNYCPVRKSVTQVRRLQATVRGY